MGIAAQFSLRLGVCGLAQDRRWRVLDPSRNGGAGGQQQEAFPQLPLAIRGGCGGSRGRWDGPAQAPEGDPSGQGACGATEEIASPPIHAQHRPAVPGDGLGHPQRPHRAQNLHQARPHPKAREDPHPLPLDLQEHRLPAPAGAGAVQPGLDLRIVQTPCSQLPSAAGFHLPGYGARHRRARSHIQPAQRTCTAMTAMGSRGPENCFIHPAMSRLPYPRSTNPPPTHIPAWMGVKAAMAAPRSGLKRVS